MVLGFRMRQRQNLQSLLVAAMIAVGTSAGAQQTTSQLFLTGVTADQDGQTVTISGGNFGASGGRFASRPFVTLDLIPLDVRAATDTAILAAVPVGSMPAAEYLLTVSRGPAPAEHASLSVKLGTQGVSTDSGAATKAAPKAMGESLQTLPSPSDTAARVGDRTISVEQVDREWRRSNPSTYLQTLRQLYEERRQILNNMVTDELLAREAAARGLTVEALLAEEVPKHVIPMPDSAVTSLYLSLGNNTRGASLDQMRPALRAWLERHSEPEIAKLSYVEELKKVSTRVDMLLDAPRVHIPQTAQDIALGPPTAAVQIVAFGDFESEPYARLAAAFSRIRETFGDRLRISFRNLPMVGPQSVPAAEAGLCANAQGKFWPFHDALIVPGPVTPERIVQSATTAGVNRESFDRCLQQREFRDSISRAAEDANQYGIQSSPSFLVNGRLAPPPPPFLAPYDYFKLLIEEELAQLSVNRAR